MAEELRFDQLARYRGAVQRHERSVAARAALVQSAGDQLLAGAGLAQDADARFARRHAVHLRHHAAHGVARMNNLVLAHALAQFAVLVFQALQLEDVLDGEQQLVGGERLLQEIDRAQPRGAHRHLDIGLSRNHDDGQRDPLAAQVFEQGEAVFARHHHVGEHHVERLGLDQFQRARGVIADGGLVPRQAEGARQRGQRVGVVVNYQQVCQNVVLSYPNSIRNVVPRPGSLSTEIRPLWSLTTDCTMASPSPVPCCLVV